LRHGMKPNGPGLIEEVITWIDEHSELQQKRREDVLKPSSMKKIKEIPYESKKSEAWHT
jgi:hypothetical protein